MFLTYGHLPYDTCINVRVKLNRSCIQSQITLLIITSYLISNVHPYQSARVLFCRNYYSNGLLFGMVKSQKRDRWQFKCFNKIIFILKQSMVTIQHIKPPKHYQTCSFIIKYRFNSKNQPLRIGWNQNVNYSIGFKIYAK